MAEILVVAQTKSLDLLVIILQSTCSGCGIDGESYSADEVQGRNRNVKYNY